MGVTKFKVGDKVRFDPEYVGPWGYFFEKNPSGVYTVTYANDRFNMVGIILDGSYRSIYKNRFILVNPITEYPEDGTWV